MRVYAIVYTIKGKDESNSLEWFVFMMVHLDALVMMHVMGNKNYIEHH
jgi:hypothetical protein